MSALVPEIAAFLDAQRVGVLATVSAEGRPRQSVVYYVRDGEQLLISTEAGRWKARDAERTGWASLCVRGEEPPYPSATLAGPRGRRARGHRACHGACRPGGHGPGRAARAP